MSKEEIVLCKMFSGSYWKNESNIGYESLNIFLPDGEDKKETPTSYIYFPADGDYAFSEHGNLKYVLLTQTICGKPEATCIKLIGEARVSKSLLKEDCDGKKYTCIGGGYNFDIMSYLYDNYQENGIPEDGKNYIELLDDMKKFFNYTSKNATGTLKKILESDSSGGKLRSDLKKLFERAKVLDSIHNAQVARLKNVTYGGKKVIDIFKNNSSFGNLNILTTLEVKDLKLFEKNIYLVNNKEAFRNLCPDEISSLFFINTQNLSCQKQTTFISSDTKISCVLLNGKEINKEVSMEKIFEMGSTAKTLDIGSIKSDSSLISIIKKEHDELTYSNLFAYFLSDHQFASHFFSKLTGKNITISRIKVRREENHIDIVVETDDSVFIIENKVRSALNGHAEKDINGEEFHDQLKRYYEYVEENYKEKNRYYFIFAPNYNPISKENFGSSSDGTEMKEVWKVVRYRELNNYCNNYSGFSNGVQQFYFGEFKNALGIHCSENLDYYREMCIRLKGI